MRLASCFPAHLHYQVNIEPNALISSGTEISWILFYKNRVSCLTGGHFVTIWRGAEGNLKAGTNLSFENVCGSNLMIRKNGQSSFRVLFPEYS